MKIWKYRFSPLSMAEAWGVALCMQIALFCLFSALGGCLLGRSYESARSAYAAGKEQEVVETLVGVVASTDEKNLWAHQILGKVYTDQNDLDRARPLFETLSDAPEDLRAAGFIGRAVLLMKEATGKPDDEYQADMREALALLDGAGEDNADAVAMAGQALLELGKYDEARQRFQTALTPRSSSEMPSYAQRRRLVPTIESAAVASNGLGVCLMLGGDWDKALARFRAAAAYGTGWLDPHLNLVRCHAARLRDLFRRWLVVEDQALAGNKAVSAPFAEELHVLLADLEQDQLSPKQAGGYLQRAYGKIIGRSDPRAKSFDANYYVLRMALALAWQVDPEIEAQEVMELLADPANEKANPGGMLHRLNRVAYSVRRLRARGYAQGQYPSRSEAKREILMLLADRAFISRAGPRVELYLRDALLAFLKPPPAYRAAAVLFHVYPEGAPPVGEVAKSLHANLRRMLDLIPAAGEERVRGMSGSPTDLERLARSLETQKYLVELLAPNFGKRAEAMPLRKDFNRLDTLVKEFRSVVSSIRNRTDERFTRDEMVVYTASIFRVLLDVVRSKRVAAEIREHSQELYDRMLAAGNAFLEAFPAGRFAPGRTERKDWARFTSR